MRSTTIRFALFALGLVAVGISSAWAGEEQAPTRAQPTGPAADAPAATVPQPPPPKTYQRWHYVPADPKGPWLRKDKHTSHVWLHDKGKHRDHRTHVHPKVWNDTIRSTDLFTITIDDQTIEPTATQTSNPLWFCLYQCVPPNWVQVGSGSSYQDLYDTQVGLNSPMVTWECRDCSEPCGTYKYGTQYFTICAAGECPPNADKCCSRAECAPCQSYPVCMPAAPGRCDRFGGLLGGRRGCGPCRR